MAEAAELDLSGARATVIDKLDGEITVKSDRAGTVVVHLSENTVIMDTQTGLPAGEDSIKTGDEVCLYCGDIMGLSEPPQVYAEAVLVNLTDEQKELLRKFDASLGNAQHEKRKNFFEKMKDAFGG